MAHEAWRLLAEKINNKPLLITEDALTPILSYLENRTEAAISNEDTKRRNAPSIAERTAMIPVSGSLSYEKTWLGAMCGMTSYQQLVEDVEEMLDLGAKTIVLDVDSGGGEAYGCFETAMSIKKRVSDAGAKLITYVDGMAASAAYALASVADEVIINPMAEAGSIGVLIRLIDSSEAMKKAGYKQIYITSAKSKVPFDADGGFKKEFLEDLQSRVDKLHTQFLDHVSMNRNISTESINNMQAKVFDAEKALQLGLVDKIMSHEDFFEYLADLEEKSSPMITNIFKPKAKASTEAITTTEEDDAMKLAELQAQYEDVVAKLTASVDQVASLESQVLEALASVDEKDAELNAALSELNAIKQASLEAANADKMAKLAAVYGDDQAQEMFDALSALPEAAFDKIVSAKRLDNQTVAQSPMFQEVGVTGDAETKEPMTAEQILVARLQKQKAQ
jgi:ClpP class serine protease